MTSTDKSTPLTSTTTSSIVTAKPTVNKKLPNLLPLEDDDEFEEFPVEGSFYIFLSITSFFA